MPKPLLYLSAYLEGHKEEYCDHLLHVSQRGRWHEWVEFFLVGVIEQARDALLRIDSLLNLRQLYGDRIQAARSSILLRQLVDDLFIYPATTITRAASRLGIAYPSAKRNVEKLVNTGILKEATGKRRNKIYTAPEIIQIIVALSADDIRH